MQDSRLQNPIRAMSIAIATGAIVASSMMFVPVVTLERLAELTGLSHVIPATSGPLGDFGRAIIAYLTGATTLCGLSILVLRQASYGASVQQRGAIAISDRTWRLDIIARLSSLMRWNKERYDNQTLTDLNPFKVGEADPDFPAPRLLVASQDLPALGSFDAVSDAMSLPTDEPQIVAEQSTAAMVAQLEAAVTNRRQTLEFRAETEAVGPAEISESRIEALSDTQEVRRPVLELVSSAPVDDNDADSALAAALATLHRMAANAR